MSHATPAQVVAAARRHIGTPWQHQGRLPGAALDCAGLVVVVARELGLVPPDADVHGYSQAPDGSMLEHCARWMEPIADIEPGAVLALVTSRQPQHLAIAAPYPVPGHWAIVHSTNAAKPPRVVEHRLVLGTHLRLAGVFRLPGVGG
jgi:cell wall-associated NlpC family hydrolase